MAGQTASVLNVRRIISRLAACLGLATMLVGLVIVSFGTVRAQEQSPLTAPAAPAKSLKEELTELKDLFDSQLINQAEYDAQRGAIMKSHGMGG